jgi:hypothetical protein
VWFKLQLWKELWAVSQVVPPPTVESEGKAVPEEIDKRPAPVEFKEALAQAISVSERGFPPYRAET